jgi:hypothetical protein
MEKVSSARISLKWGLILGLFGIVTSTVMYTMGWFSQMTLNFILLVVFFIGVLYFAFKEFKELNGGLMSYGQGVGLGILLFVTAGVIVGTYDFVYKQFIDTTLVEKQLGIFEEQYESMGMSPEVIEQSLDSARMWIDGPLALLGSVFNYAFMGFICSLIMAAIMKKNQPVFE